MKIDKFVCGCLVGLTACSGLAETKSSAFAKAPSFAKATADKTVDELSGSRPNIILVMTDDQGMGDLSCMGNQVVKTPNIDRFHDQAVRFTDFHVSPTCAPTRSAIMSGRAPFKNGVTHTILQRERMALDTFTLPQALKTAGYATGIFGKWHLGDEEAYLPGNRGFDEVLIHGAGGIGQVGLGDFPPNKENLYFDNVLLHNDTIVQTKGFCTDLFFQAGLAWIKKQHDSKRPYFAYIALNAPHAPLVAPERYKKRFLDMGYDQGTAGRYGMIENIDDNFGRMLEKLAEWKALDNTLVIFMTDNGATHLSGKLNGEKVRHFNANLRGGKNSPYEGGTHVPAFWYWKGVFGGGVDVDALTAHVDLYKTFCELAGVTLPIKIQELDGRSLLPLLKDPKTDWPDRELFIHCGRWPTGQRDAFKFKKCAARTQRWRFVNNTELYDVSSDPGETKDVASAHPEVVQHLRKSFDGWWGSVLPLMVNEGLPRVFSSDQPLAKRYEKQLKEQGIPEWNPPAFPSEGTVSPEPFATSMQPKENSPIGESSFCKSLVPGKFILPAKEGWWNWGMAPIYDETGKLHIFNSSIPYKGEKGMGYWQSKSIINHYVAHSVEGPYELVGTVFSSDERTYHNPQVSKVGDTYVLVFLWKSVEKGSLQSIGMATAKSLNGPWTENPNNPIIRPTPGTSNAAHTSNPSFLVDRDGKFRIYYKSMSEGSKYREISVAIADQIDGPYVDHPGNPLISYKDMQRDVEDPYAFFYRDTYYMIVEDRMDVAGALSGNPSPSTRPGGNRPGLLFTSKDGIRWGRPELSYKTDAHYFGKELSRTERPHILWKDGKPEYLFLANHGSRAAGFYLKIEGWKPEEVTGIH